MKQRKSTAAIAVAACLLFPPARSVAGAIEITGSVTSCDASRGCLSDFPVGTPTYTQVVFDHNLIDRQGFHSYPVGQIHGSFRVWIDGDLWTEQDDFEYWNEMTPWSPEHGWYSPDLQFQDGRLVGIDFFEPNGGPSTPGLTIGYPPGFYFDLSIYVGPGSEGTLASVAPPFLPEPGTLGMLGLGLAGLGLGSKRALRRPPPRTTREASDP